MPGNSVSSPMAPRLLADQVDAVIGVDTHTDTHSACLVNQIGAPLAEITVTAGAAGYAALVTWAREQQLAAGLGPRLVWAVEGSRSHGTGLVRALHRNGETALEAARPTRLARRPGGKSDPKDALHAARTALATSIIYQPRADGPREALRTLLIVRASAVTARTDAINQLKSLVLQAPDQLREQLRGLPTTTLIAKCRELPALPSPDCRQVLRDPRTALVEAEDRARLTTMRRLAHRIHELSTEADEAEGDILVLVRALAPQLLQELGIGPLTAAQILVSWSHRGRVPSEAAFAALAGVSPLDASSGRQQRHRLTRHGDRALNQTLHFIAVTRERCDPRTRAYIARRVAEGKTHREARRLVKRYLARRIYRQLEHLESLPSATRFDPTAENPSAAA